MLPSSQSDKICNMLSVIKTRKIWFWFSGLLIAAGLVSIALWQFKFGIDFTGGSLIEVAFKDPVPAVSEVRDTLTSFGVETIQPTGERAMLVRLPPLTQQIHLDIQKKLDERFGSVTENRFETIGPTIGEELRNKALVALGIVFAAIIFYIAYTFRRVSKPISSWVYGVITVITALHDVAIPLGVFSLLGKFSGVEIGSGFVAAILTIMGYSINDTIVVLDRVRENLSRRSGNFEDVVEQSVHQSFARSLNTTITTLLALVAIYFFGGASVKYFSLALILGIATGAYSSLFIAAPLLVVWNRRKLARR